MKLTKLVKAKKTIVISIFLLIAILLVYNQKIQSKILKIGFITDWEYEQIDNNTTKDLLLSAVSHYNYISKPDLVVGGGDYLKNNQETKSATLNSFQEVNAIFKKIKAFKFYCLGKKDYQMNYFQEVKQLLNLNNSYYSQNFKDINVIILDTTQNNKTNSAQGSISKNQLDWLTKEFLKPEPVLIFSHHSLIETPDGDIWRQNLTNQDEVLDLIKENEQKIIAIFSGNSKKDYITKESGLPFINIGGLTNEDTLGRFSDIKITPDQKSNSIFLIELNNQGKNSSTYNIKRDLKIKTATRITLEEQNQTIDNQYWFDLEDEQYPKGILNEETAGEPNLGITKNGTVITAFENKEKAGKIQVKIYKDKKWINLSDENHPEGLISFGKGSNPNIETKDEDIFLIFTETEYNDKPRLLNWSNSQQKWNELTPQGFLSEKSGHEPTLVFDKNKKNLYVAFAEQISSEREQTQAKIKKWDGTSWETISKSLLIFANQSNSSVDEFDLAASNLDNSIYMSYEEIKIDGTHTIQVIRWDGSKWNNLENNKFYLEKISKINGFSPSIALNNDDNLFLTFVENNKGPLRIYQYDKISWKDLGVVFENSPNEVIEPFIEIDKNNNLFLAYSEYKNNVVLKSNNGKNTGEELIKTSAWRVRVQKLKNNIWIDCEDDLNYSGYISKGSGKGDPALKTFKNNLYIIFSDEENNYSARVKKYTIN